MQSFFPIFPSLHNATVAPYVYNISYVLHAKPARKPMLLPAIDLDELLFVILASFLLYCYIGLIRIRPQISHRPYQASTRTNVVPFYPRKPKRSSGLTTKDIEEKLKSFCVDEHPNPDNVEVRKVTGSSSSGECIISFAQKICSICLEEYDMEPNARLRQLPCNHVFHVGKFLHTSSPHIATSSFKSANKVSEHSTTKPS